MQMNKAEAKPYAEEKIIIAVLIISLLCTFKIFKFIMYI